MLIAYAIAMLLYLVVCFMLVKRLLKASVTRQNTNIQHAMKAFIIVILFTPTISVPATLPIPAILQLFFGLFMLHIKLALVGLVPIVIVALVLFMPLKIKYLHGLKE